MKLRIGRRTPCLLALVAMTGIPAWAQDSETAKLKATVESMQKTMQEMQQRINQLEREKSRSIATNGITPLSASVLTLERIGAGEEISHQSPVTDRGTMKDTQEGAQRPKDYTLDPKYT